MNFANSTPVFPQAVAQQTGKDKGSFTLTHEGRRVNDYETPADVSWSSPYRSFHSRLRIPSTTADSRTLFFSWLHFGQLDFEEASGPIAIQELVEREIVH